MSAGSAPPPRTRVFLYGSSCPLLRVVQRVLRPTSAVARGHMERSDRAVASTGVAHTVVLRRGLSYRSRQHGKLGLASRSVKTGRQHGRGGGRYRAGWKGRVGADSRMSSAPLPPLHAVPFLSRLLSQRTKCSRAAYVRGFLDVFGGLLWRTHFKPQKHHTRGAG